MKSLYCVTMCKHGKIEFATFLVTVMQHPSTDVERTLAKEFAERECHSDYGFVGSEYICTTESDVCTEV